MTDRRVMVAMSGGVDSAVTALLLLEQGYEVVGLTLDMGVRPMAATDAGDAAGTALPSMFSAGDGGAAGDAGDATDAVCRPVGDPAAMEPSPETLSARSVCEALGIEHIIVSAAADFSCHVIEHFVSVYQDGATPNPCIDCNRFIKFPYLLAEADRHACGFVATGHYARVEHDNPHGHALLRRGIHRAKDQSYVLYGLGRATLERLLLPLGGLAKDEVRERASARGLPCAQRPESQDICFVPDGDHVGFLERQGIRKSGGAIVDAAGDELGSHEGLYRYTIGQRHGLNIGGREPLYVLEKDARSDILRVGPREALFVSACRVTDVNWLVDAPHMPLSTLVKTRYRTAPVAAMVIPDDDGRGALITFATPFDAVAPGQAAVFYGDGSSLSDDIVLGGGTITESIPS